MKAAEPMSAWKPTTRQLEIIAELGNARTSAEAIAAALGVTPEEFSAWVGRLVATRSAPEPDMPLPLPKPVPVAAPSLRIVADRVFEMPGGGDAENSIAG